MGDGAVVALEVVLDADLPVGVVLALGALVAALPDDAPLDGTVDHDFFGGLHCKAWYLFQRVHDLDHAGQIAQIQAAPGYPAPGYPA